MKNFEMRCPVDGTSALQPEFEQASAPGAIIEFPGCASQNACVPRGRSHARRAASATVRRVRGRLATTEMVQTLHRGSAAGCAYGRVRPWQGVLAGCVFSALAFVSIFIGL